MAPLGRAQYENKVYIYRYRSRTKATLSKTLIPFEETRRLGVSSKRKIAPGQNRMHRQYLRKRVSPDTPSAPRMHNTQPGSAITGCMSARIFYLQEPVLKPTQTGGPNMARKATTFKYSKHVIGYGFALVLILLVGIAVLGVRQMAVINHEMQTLVEQQNVKTNLVFAMYSAARERALLLHAMTLSTDPFEQDEQYMQFNAKATEFAVARTRWLEMNPGAEEKAIIAQQGKLTSIAAVVQLKVAETIREGKIKEANRMLLQEGIPIQNKVLDTLTVLLSLQHQASRKVTEQATREYRYASASMLVLGAIAVILGIITAVLVTRRVTKTEDELFHEKELAEITLHSIGDAVITTDLAGNVDHINPVAEELTGWSADLAHAAPLSRIFCALDETTRAPLELMPAQVVAGGAQRIDSHHALLIRKDGQEFVIEGSRAPIRNAAEEMIGSVLVFRDVSKARTLAQQLSWQASHDELTGLANRRAFELLLQQHIDNSRSSDRRHALLYIDLDNFKIVNDTCGHESGDELLRQLAGVLSNKLRESDTLARLGGDEFGVLLEGCSIESGMRIANDVLGCIQEFRFAWDAKVFSVGVSIGLVAIDADTPDITSVLSAADHACYTAKDMGRNRIHLFQQNDREVTKRQGEMQWVSKINSALSENRFRLYYQNIQPLAVRSKAVEHCEILLRMLDENGDIVLPMAFIPAAERYGLMPAIDRWVIGTLFGMLGPQMRAKTLMARRTQDERFPMYAINLSGASLNDDTFLTFVQEQIQRHGITPNVLCFEITETAAIINLKRASYFIQELKRIGCRFALDDFGSGMSSFGYLKALPVDYLKIDGSFVVDILHDPTDYAMVDAINRVGHILGIQTVAEWVENAATREVLRNLGVDFLQGNGVHYPELLTVLPDKPYPGRYLKDVLPGTLH